MRLYEAINQEIGSREAKLTKNEAALRTIARMGWGTFTIRMLQEATDLSYSRTRRILQGYTAKGTVYAGLLEKCSALAVVDVTVTDNSTEETIRRHELLFQFDAGRYREWTAGLSVWLEEGCKEIGPEPGKEAVFPGYDLRSFATPPPAEGVLGVGIPGLQCSPAPGGVFERVRVDIGRCDLCGSQRAAYRSREARAKICEGCYAIPPGGRRPLPGILLCGPGGRVASGAGVRSAGRRRFDGGEAAGFVVGRSALFFG